MNRFGSNSHSGGDRFSSKPQSHEAVCANCGKSCTIPFKPTGDRPVYCSDCFETVGGGSSGGRSSGGRRDSRGGGGRRDSRGGGSDRKEMFSAVCDDCGAPCQVPFKPTGEKPVYCSDCYEKNGGKNGSSESRSDRRSSFSGGGSGGESNSRIEMKLDRIMAMLELLVPQSALKNLPDLSTPVRMPSAPMTDSNGINTTIFKKIDSEDEELR